MSNKALFLDRDGIINIDHGYVHQIQEFDFSPDIFTLLKLFTKHNYKLFIVTNQSGIERGYYTLQDFQILTEWMLERLRNEDIIIEAVEYCPHTPKVPCNCRKPMTGMVDKILSRYDIDLSNSWLIGDKQSDINLAHNATIAHTIAIGHRVIKESEYKFQTITECKEFFEKNLYLLGE